MISELTGFDQLVAFTFLFTFFGMIAAALFFFVERERVPAEYRQSVVMASLICGIAALNYFYMKDLFIESAAAGETVFPTEFRYIDWFLTVPIMILKFPSLLGLGERGRSVMVRLVVLATAMIAFGFIGELNPDNQGIHLGLYGIACVAGIGIFAILGPAVRDLPDHISETKKRTIVWMGILVLAGWVVYPIGYLQPTLGFRPEIRELIYNLSDLVNKVGLGLIVYFGGRRALLDEEAAATPTVATPDLPIPDYVAPTPEPDVFGDYV